MGYDLQSEFERAQRKKSQAELRHIQYDKVRRMYVKYGAKGILEQADQLEVLSVQELEGRVVFHFMDSSRMELSNSQAVSYLSDGIADQNWQVKHTEPTSAPSPRPPINAEFILHMLLKKDEEDAVLGDLLERYNKKCARLGVRRANLWFCVEVFRTTWPLVKRLAIKGGLVALGQWIWRHI